MGFDGVAEVAILTITSVGHSNRSQPNVALAPC